MKNFSYINKKLAKNQSLTDGINGHNKKASSIRLFYVAFAPFVGYDNGALKVGQTYGISSPFKLPKGMTVQDACKVVSYLSDLVEKRNNLEPACEQSVILVSHMLEDYGFKKIETKSKGRFHSVSYYDSQRISTELSPCKKIEGVVDLFSVDGNFDIFKKSDLSDRYFEWYTEGVTNQEVANIYKNINNTEEFGYKK